jgi:DNA-binding CsgD family transcriptional regulator
VVSDAPNAISGADLECFNHFFYQHPLVRYHAAHRDGGSRMISDSLSAAQFRNSALFNEYYRRIGVDRVLAVPMLVDASLLVSFVLNRRGRDFSEQDRALADSIRHALAATYRNALALDRANAAVATLRELSAEGDLASFDVDARGRYRRLTPAATALLRQCWPDAIIRPGAAVPPDLARWLSRLAPRALATRREGRFEVAASAGKLILHGMPGTRRGAQVTVFAHLAAAARAPVVDPVLPLTTREREVLSWVGAGKTNPQIAAILGCSARTVQKHLEHVYVKLGVETRTAAVARAMIAPAT